MLLGLPVSRSDMEIGGEEEAALATLAAPLPTPPLGPRDGGRWALVDITCQVMFVGDDTGLHFVFPTSTGEVGHETRIVSEARAFRFDPAVDNNGWHDSSESPVGYDNRSTAAACTSRSTSATARRSTGPTTCRRRRPARVACACVGHHDQLVEWLGLAGKTSPVWNENTIGLRVTTRGTYLQDP